ncbi:hypothetical protein [Nonomuraea sp. NPDC005650]|uniref:hypothetical protein n=1 Tax=Nonomuraea sp. NPDC005650 TaxID=3157045 RepID=UPI0033AE976A
MKRFTGRTLPVLVLLAVAAAGCGAVRDPRGSVTVTASPEDTTPAADPTSTPPGTATPTPRGGLVAGRYQPLWPFSTPGEATAWREAYRRDGRQAWHLDAGRTAIAFTRDYLGFTEIDQVAKSVRSGDHARVHVAYNAEEGPRALVAAVVHLVRYGTGEDAPWEVVGTDDTSFSLTRPRYGAVVRSPLTVGGKITGVDESVRVQVRRPGSTTPVGESCCVGAGGTDSPWAARVAFKAPPGRTLTVVASTGGHVATVERFAVTGVNVLTP